MNMNTQDIHTSLTIPVKTFKTYNRKTVYYIPYDIVKDGDTYKYKCITIPASRYSYEGMIDVIMGIKYDLGKTVAIISNYLAEPDNAEYRDEFNEYQKWRIYAKTESKKHFNKL